MARLSKRKKSFLEKVEDKKYSLDDALTLAKDLSNVKFIESVDVAIKIGIDPKKSDQVVRGSTVLPKGTGKSVRVAVFTNESLQSVAKEAGADLVGLKDLVDEVKKGTINFDVVIASPDAMGEVGQLGQILGPKGLMPNPKTGTVTQDVTTAVKNAKSGQVRYRADKGGIIHTSIGKSNFSIDDLKENFNALLGDVKKAKPETVKGVYIQAISISTTMGPGVKVEFQS